MPELPESRVETNMYLAELQLNTMMMSLRNPRLARIVGWVRAGGVGSEVGVKVVEGYRSPSPGGTTERPGMDEHPWGVRRGVSEAGGGLAGMHEMPESRYDFSLHDADGERVMRQECPEIRRGKAENGELKMEIGILQVEMPEKAESGCDFILQDADEELVMAQECPEFPRWVEGQRAKRGGQRESSGLCAGAAVDGANTEQGKIMIMSKKMSTACGSTGKMRRLRGGHNSVAGGLANCQ